MNAGRRAGWTFLASACLLAAGCRIEHRAAAGAAATGGQAPPPGGQFTNQAFDPKAQVADIWTAKVLPALQARAGEFNALRTAMKVNLDAAGAQHGHRERGEGAAWNFATTLKGRIVGGDATLSAAKVDVDTDGDGKADAQLQIGPIIRGTALRDALPFISFTAYTNQVEFAQVANAFNDHAAAQALQGLPRDKLMGRAVEVLGVFTTDDAAEMPVILPVQMKVEAP